MHREYFIGMTLNGTDMGAVPIIETAEGVCIADGAYAVFDHYDAKGLDEEASSDAYANFERALCAVAPDLDRGQTARVTIAGEEWVFAYYVSADDYQDAVYGEGE